MADSIITNLIQQLGGLAVEEYKVLKGVEGQLKSLENELRIMKKFLRNSDGKQNEHEIVRELVEQIKMVAFEAEDIIETFLLNVEKQERRSTFKKVVHGPEHAMMLRGMSNQIKDIKTSIDEIYANKEKYGIEIGEGSMNPHFQATLQRRRNEVDEEMVGFKDVADMLLRQLTDGSTPLEIVSIVGMGGLGKTTVAKSLYNDRIIKDHFDNQAWVSVSEDYDTNKVILDILERVAPNSEGLDKLGTDKLKERLRGRLKNKKYIVFLDDVWQPNMWDEVKACFPDNGNHSRVVITTRNAEVARHASPREPHFLRFFTPKESWELFEKMVFRGHPCPTHLKPLGTDIMERCKGLPLSIVVIGSMLGSQEKSERIWERTLKDVSVHLGKDEACLEILALSYHNLPAELKPCFLYFAAFPEDHEMSVRRLIALWLAEGFIQPLGELTLEDVAESYLDALINRSLVQAGTRRKDGGLKKCRIHDLVRDLCIREAKHENFMWAPSKINSNSYLPVVSSNTSSSLPINKSRPRRLSAHHHTTRMVLQSPDLDPSSVRALLSFESQLGHLSSAFWKTLYTNYKLLRVLDLGAVKATTMPGNISSLVNLRYLRLFLSSSSIPTTIFDLWNLQMLFLEGNQPFVVPIGTLLKLQNLQHLILGERSRLFGDATALLRKNQLKGLQVLSSILPDSDFERAVMNGLCPYLRKLAVCNSNDNNWSLKNFLVGLPHLQSLKISHSDSDNVHDYIFRGVQEYNLPSGITKITLKSSKWSYSSINMLGNFPRLRVLKMVDVQYFPISSKTQTTYWRLPFPLFPQLHTLHLDNVSLVSMGDISFRPLYSGCVLDEPPQQLAELRHLFLKKCTCILSSSLFHLPNLKDVEVLWPSIQLGNYLKTMEAQSKVKYRLLVYGLTPVSIC